MGMPIEVRDRWVAALRSGEYEQTNRTLHDRATGAFCANGVLLDTLSYDWGNSAMSGSYKRVNELLGDVNRVRVENLNDGFGWSFERIAEWVEQNVPVS